MRIVTALAVLAATGCAALADDGPVIVVPSRPGVPIVINGRDVSYAVLEGDWGLAKRIHVQPTIYDGYWHGVYKPPVGHYYPHTGRMPGYGRYEIDAPPRQLPQAETYYRAWGAELQPTPPTVPQDSVPFDPPAVILAPSDRRHRPPRHFPAPHAQGAGRDVP